MDTKLIELVQHLNLSTLSEIDYLKIMQPFVYLRDEVEQRRHDYVEWLDMVGTSFHPKIIPDKFKFPGWQSEKNCDGQTALMKFVSLNCKIPEPIPEELKYTNWQEDTDAEGHTPMMLFIMSYPAYDIPKELFFNECQSVRDNQGRTPLLIWISQEHDRPIPWNLYYPGWMQDLKK